MKKINRNLAILRIGIVTFLLSVFSLLLFSFTVSKKIADDFLKQLGISKTAADKKISTSFLEGYLDAYGAKNVKNITLGKRTAMAKDLLNHAKTYVNSAVFIKEYAALKESKKPAKSPVKTPEEMQKGMIDDAKKSVAETESSLKKADPQFKKIFEEVLVQSKKQLKEAEDPKNKNIAAYRKNYENLVKQVEQEYSKHIAEWESAYPTNHMLFVKKRLGEFLNETKDIDFNAELTTKAGKKIFVKREYETKGSRWKMAYRAGKEVVEPAREFVKQWIYEIK